MRTEQLKEVIGKINIKSEMEEEILKNVINEETKRLQTGITTNKKRKKWQSRAVAAAVTLVVVGAGGVTAHALVDSLVKERMENMPQEEVKNIVDEIDSQQVNASTYSRELTDEETARMRDLTIAYQKGEFPEGELKRVTDESQVDEDVLCFVPDTSYFYLPDRELTDEELLQMIDYSKKANYALQKRYEEEYAEEVQAKEEERQELAKTTQAEGGISEGEAIAKAEEWLSKLYGETPDGMEMSHYIESAEESVATSLDGSAVYCIIYSIEGSDNYYFYISGNGDLLSAEHSSAGQLDAAELTLSEAESKVQTLYQTAEEQLKDFFGISEDYAEIYCRYRKNAAGDGIDMNLMIFYFVKEDRTAYKLSFICDNMELREYSIKNFDEVVEIAKKIEDMGVVNESIQTKLK